MTELVIDYIAPTEWVDADCGHKVPAHFANRHVNVNAGGEPKYHRHSYYCVGPTSSFGETEGEA